MRSKAGEHLLTPTTVLLFPLCTRCWISLTRWSGWGRLSYRRRRRHRRLPHPGGEPAVGSCGNLLRQARYGTARLFPL